MRGGEKITLGGKKEREENEVGKVEGMGGKEQCTPSCLNSHSSYRMAHK